MGTDFWLRVVAFVLGVVYMGVRFYYRIRAKKADERGTIGAGGISESKLRLGLMAVGDEDSVLYGQRVAADSTLSGGTIVVSDYASSKSVPAMAFDTLERSWWVVWADNRDYG